MTNLNVNGKEYSVDISEDMPILWVLRDILKLKGTKFGCGKGLCGSCTILLDGVAIRSCSTPILIAKGRKLMTIEGLSKDGTHPLQEAWKKQNVPQCGYCQAGQIMNAAGLLNQNQSPSREDIRSAMSGNICRCGTYKRIENAILSVSKSN